MKNIRILLFFLFLGTYVIGVAAGCMGQVKSARQAEMYDYLSSAVTEYNANASKSIKSVAADNIKLFLPAAAGGLFKAGILIIAAVIFIKGYSAGFSVTAVLRLYGIRGIVLCGANFLSILFIIPALAYYGSVSAYGLIWEFEERRQFYKRYFFCIVILALIMLADSFTRGFLSSLFMKFAGVITKTA